MPTDPLHWNHCISDASFSVTSSFCHTQLLGGSSGSPPPPPCKGFSSGRGSERSST